MKWWENYSKELKELENSYFERGKKLYTFLKNKNNGTLELHQPNGNKYELEELDHYLMLEYRNNNKYQALVNWNRDLRKKCWWEFIKHLYVFYRKGFDTMDPIKGYN